MNELSRDEQRPVAWLYKLATTKINGEYANFITRVSLHEPHVPDEAIADVQPLYTAPPKRQPLNDIEKFNQELDLVYELQKAETLNADLLKQLSSYQIDWESQEDLLEQLYLAFAEDRENEKISFKDKMKFFAGQINQYANELIAALRTKRQPLSDTEIQKLYMEASLVDSGFVNPFARLIEAAHGIGVEE